MGDRKVSPGRASSVATTFMSTSSGSRSSSPTFAARPATARHSQSSTMVCCGTAPTKTSAPCFSGSALGPISTLATFLEHTSGYRQDLRRVEYGDERDSTLRAWMERTAPLNNVDKVTKPLFIVQGMNDPRVPRSEAEQMVAALKRRGVPVWYLMAKDEGHGFRKKGNQDFQFYATILFTERYLLGAAGSATP